MSTLLQYRYTLRQYLMTLIGICLCTYFGYHIVHGERSITKLIHLSQKIETVSNINDSLHQERSQIEERVVMMRPGSINKDLLEEQVRLVLGYKDKDEVIILSN